jgi:hypothetical protein
MMSFFIVVFKPMPIAFIQQDPRVSHAESAASRKTVVDIMPRREYEVCVFNLPINQSYAFGVFWFHGAWEVWRDLVVLISHKISNLSHL